MRLENITVHGSRMLSSTISGLDAEHDVRGVTFRNVHLAGQPPATNAAALRLECNAFVKDIRVEP